MRSRDSVVRLKRFQVDEKRRQVAQIDGMIGEFLRVAADLEVQIASEEERTGIRDIAHFAYSTFAKAAIQRRDNLRSSADELRVQRDLARHELSEAEEELAKLEALADRDRGESDERRPAEMGRGRNSAA